MLLVPFITMDQLRIARYALKLTTREVAAALGVSAMNLTQIENGKTNPRANTLLKLAEFYEAQGAEFRREGWVRLRPAA